MTTSDFADITYGSIHKLQAAKHAAQNLQKGFEKAAQAAKGGRPALPVLIGCIFIPWLLFCATIWLRSFEVRYNSESSVELLSLAFAVVPMTFGYMTFDICRNGGDIKPMSLLFTMSTIALSAGYFLGDYNFHTNMQPYYDISKFNKYPSVDPAKYVGQQMMDAGQIEFVPSTRLWLQKSVGFKNGDVYCVAPIVNQNAIENKTQETFDFWAVGVNCCSGHQPDFHCGEYTNPSARTGLRLMADDVKPMFRLAVKQAEANFNIKSPHPIFLYWLQNPQSEVNAYQDDGFKYFSMSVFAAFAVQLFVVTFSTVIFAKVEFKF